MPELAPLLSVPATASLSLAGVNAPPVPFPVGVGVAVAELLWVAVEDDPGTGGR